MSGRAIQRIARYQVDGEVRRGRLAGDRLVRVSAPPWRGGGESGGADARAQVRLLPPVVPTKIVCVGLNYMAHVAESATVLPGAEPPAEPLLFLKPPSALIASG